MDAAIAMHFARIAPLPMAPEVDRAPAKAPRIFANTRHRGWRWGARLAQFDG
jgi:hypothetical protein